MAPQPNMDTHNSELAPFMSEFARDRYKLRCRELARYIGHEVDVTPQINLDVGAALELLNQDSHLGLDAKDSEILTLVLDVLALNAKRFGGTKEIEAKKGENSTTHAMMSVALSDRVFEAAGIVKPGETEQLKRMSALGVLLHDAGEALGELSTNDQQFKGGAAAKEQAGFIKNEVEFYVLDFVMTKAAQALDIGTPKAIQNFYNDMQSMRKQLGFVDSRGIPKGIAVMDRFEDIKQKLDVSDIRLSPEWAEKRDIWMGVWHLAEYGHIDSVKSSTEYTQDQGYKERVDAISTRVQNYIPLLEQHNLSVADKNFYTAFVKNIDKMQGTRHFSRYLDKRKDFKHFILEHYTPERVGKQVYNLEKTLHGLFTPEGTQPSSDQETLARYSTALSYETISDIFRQMNPLPIPRDVGGTGHATHAPAKKLIRQHVFGDNTKAIIERRGLQQCLAEQHWWSDLYNNAKYGTLAGTFTPQEQTIEKQISAGQKPEGLTIPDVLDVAKHLDSFNR